MPFVAKKCTRIPRLSDLIAVTALHMNRRAPQVAALDKSAHASRHMAKLIIMACRYFQALVVRKRNQRLRVGLAKHEGLFHVDIAPQLKAELRDAEMAFRWRRDVDNIGFGFTQKLRHVAEVFFDRKP